MKEWLLVLKAADAAARWHVHHRRKGPSEEPYINHLLEVAMLVAEATGGSDTNLVIAALLHDAIEDSEVPQPKTIESGASLIRRVCNMQFSDDCRSRALVLMEIANESPNFKEQTLALAESWLTLANIHNRFCSNPSYSGPLDGSDANH